MSLVVAERVRTIEFVLEELEDNAEYADGAHLRLRKVADKLLVPWQPLLMRAGEIADKFPRLSPYRNPRTKADTLILAAAETYDLTVVCNETRTTSRQQMPIACKRLGIRCRNLVEFVSDEKLELG